MFDRIVQGPSYPQHISKQVDVKEYRAPTDESVKLLRQMEQDALSNILKRMKLPNNVIEAEVHHQKDLARWADLYYIRLKINGKDYSVEAPVDRDSKPENVTQVIVKHLADHLAQVILSGVQPITEWPTR